MATPSRQNRPPEIERLPWRELRVGFLDSWQQGEHVAVIGPTGSGKTTLMADIAEGAWDRGGSLVLLANKKRDPLLDELLKQGGWHRVADWPPHYVMRKARKVIVWPKYRSASRARENSPALRKALDGILNEGKWFVLVDELMYLIEQMGLRAEFDELWHQSRSSKVTLIGGSQGVSWVPKGQRTQVRWRFLFKPENLEDRKDYAIVAGDRDVADALGTLQDHEFILVHPKGTYISKVGT